MTLRPVAKPVSAVLLALAGLFAAGGASAQSPAAQPDEAQPAEVRPAEAQRTTTAAASMRPLDGAVQSAAAPAEALVQSDRPTQMAEPEREAARARRLERREIISEGIGISVDDLNDLLRRVRPSAEERRQGN
jgi:hypothetical protein